MTELQRSMFELVLEIEEICQKHNITYYLAGGSVLGAVRHKGFIPWDDDIDICMTREEFEKFYKAAQTDMAPDREIITTENTPCHTKVTIKYMNKSSSQFFRSQVLDNTGCGISLDIFILDPLPKDPALKEEHIGNYVAYNELLTPFFMVFPGFYKYVNLYKEYKKEMKKEGKEKVMEKLYNKLFVEEPKESELYLYRWGQMHLIYNKELFGKPRYLEFEGHKLPMPEKTIEFLRSTYGDTWKYLPPQGQRDTHVSNVSSTISYNNWLKDIKQFQNPKAILRDFVVRKKANVNKAPLEHELLVAELKRLALAFELLFEKDKEYSFESLSALSNKELLSFVSNYLKHQLDGKFVKNNIYFNIPDNTLGLILKAFINTGSYVKANKLLNLRLAQKQAPQSLLEIKKEIEQLQYFIRYFEDAIFNEKEQDSIEVYSEKLINALKEKPTQIDLLRAYLQLLIKTENYNTTEALSAYNLYKEDKELAYYAGVILEKAGQKDESLFEIAENTDNGLILQGLKERN